MEAATNRHVADARIASLHRYYTCSNRSCGHRPRVFSKRLARTLFGTLVRAIRPVPVCAVVFLGTVVPALAQTDDDATLSRLALTQTESGDGVMLDPVFDPAILQYTAEVPVGVETITLDAVANHARATLKYLNVKESELADAEGDTDGFQAGLMLGATVLKVRVEAESGMKQTYSVSVFRPGPPLSLRVDTVADDDVVNIAEKADGFSIAGTVLDDKSDAMSNATVTVEIAGETLTATSGSDGTWSVDLPAAADYVSEPSVTVTVNATKPPLLPAPEVARTLTVDLTSPTLVSATAERNRVDLTYDEDLTITGVPTSTFSVTVSDIVLSDILGVGIAHGLASVFLPQDITPGDTVTVSYSGPDTEGRAIRDRADNPVADFADHAVTNITKPGEPCVGSEGSVRLVDGADSKEGRVEICADDITD
ncbi:MAG: cadherin-like beta sandwich domain-containing protein, partial [Rhodospirillaceae bacterium]|nr:cadherin-like beta sandwich domain-containing protein [Rhodospirillaceae bacterium]